MTNKTQCRPFAKVPNQGQVDFAETTETDNGNGKQKMGKTFVYMYYCSASLFTGPVDWTGLDSPMQNSIKCLIEFIVGQKLNIYSSFLESVEVKGHVHI